MKWLIINTEAFSTNGIKDLDFVDKSMLPRILLLFLKAVHYPFIILDESSKIKTNTAMKEAKKSSRCRMIKLLSDVGERTAMTGTLKSKSPLNVYDQIGFLDPTVFPETMFEFAERYCIMETIRVGRGRRVCISQKDYARIRNRLVRAYSRGGDMALGFSKMSIFKESVISEENLDWIMAHPKYTPFIHQDELYQRIAAFTTVVKREDVFDISFEKFVHEPIVRYVEPSKEQISLTRKLVDLGFTDNFQLGKVPALELLHRCQDVCNGFEPIIRESDTQTNIKNIEGYDMEVGKRIITYRPLKESPKMSMLMELIDEIDPEENQIVVFSARDNFTDAIKAKLTEEEISFVHYYGANKEEAEKEFVEGNASIFLSNMGPAAYGLNCLSRAKYIIYACANHQTEVFYQSKHRILRGQLTEPKFAYHICVRKSIEERLIESLRVGVDLIENVNGRKMFTMED